MTISGSRRFTFIIFLVTLILTTSTTANARLSEPDLEAIQLLVLGEKDNPVKQCLDTSMETFEGLVAFGLARTNDENVVDALTTGVTDASQLEMRKQLARMWKEHHQPNKLANYQFGSCVGKAAELGELGDRCFSVATVPAFASLLKGVKTPKEDTVKKAMKSWNSQVPESWLRKVIDDIYTADDPEVKRNVFRRVFIGCLVTNNHH